MADRRYKGLYTFQNDAHGSIPLTKNPGSSGTPDFEGIYVGFQGVTDRFSKCFMIDPSGAMTYSYGWDLTGSEISLSSTRNIEFWMNLGEISTKSLGGWGAIYLYGSSGWLWVGYSRHPGEEWAYRYSSGTYNVKSTAAGGISSDEWFRMTVTLKSTTKFDWDVNGVNWLTDGNHDLSDIQKIWIGMSNGYEHEVRFASVGFDWEQYNKGDNASEEGIFHVGLPRSAIYRGTWHTDDTSRFGWSESGSSVVFAIVDDIGGHDKVYKLTDNGGSAFNATREYTEHSVGSIEYWFRTDNSTYDHYLYNKTPGGSTLGVPILVNNGYFRYWNGNTGAWVQSIACSVDTWYRIRLDFDCTASRDAGGTGKYSFYIDDTQRASNIDTYSSVASLGQFQYASVSTGAGYSGYLDAIGFTAIDKSYNLGDNKKLKEVYPTAINGIPRGVISSLGGVS